ncbi:MAG: ABC transporter ATP-binding protein [Nitratireductor sp.]
MSTLLKLSNVTAFYGVSQALFDVNLSIKKGQVVALMGRNGMGKTTTVHTLCSLLPSAGGTISFKGQDIKNFASHSIAQLGVGLVPEGRRCFPNLTVKENLLVAAKKGKWNAASIVELFPRLGERENQFANTLSGGEQQMLAIGRALMTNPELLILDEATEGLAPVVRQEIWASISKLKQSGLSILIVDKSLSELLKVVDQCVLLEKGASVWHGAPKALTAKLQDRYLGI